MTYIGQYRKHAFNVTELDYLYTLELLLNSKTRKDARNGMTRSLPFETLEFNIERQLPILTTRKIYYPGVLGEYAAFIRGPKHINDFKKFGCNFWDQWADDAGNINVDYGNTWINFNGINQMQNALDTLRTNPYDRRILINGWNPANIDKLSLPCCHYSYQFWSDGKVLDLLWNQRSADWMIGMPSDIIVASVMLLCFSNLANLKPRNVKMVIGDAHIYEEHVEAAKLLLTKECFEFPTYTLKPQKDLYSFIPSDLKIINYTHHDPIKLQLKE